MITRGQLSQLYDALNKDERHQLAEQAQYNSYKSLYAYAKGNADYRDPISQKVENALSSVISHQRLANLLVQIDEDITGLDAADLAMDSMENLRVAITKQLNAEDLASTEKQLENLLEMARSRRMYFDAMRRFLENV